MLDGVVEMRYRVAGVEKSTLLETGDIFLVEQGCEHVAHRCGPVRVLVVEKEGFL